MTCAEPFEMAADSRPETQASTAAESDWALLRRHFQAGDAGAMEELFRRHADVAYRVALGFGLNSVDAEDALQSAFLQVLQNGERCLSQGASESNIRGWIMSIVVNTCRMELRSKASRAEREANAEIPREAPAVDAQKAEEIRAAVHLAKGLPERYRLPVWLHYLEGYTFKEVAGALALPEGTVRMQASRGLEQLRDALTTSGFAVTTVALPELLASALLPTAPAAVSASVKVLIAKSLVAKTQAAIAASAGTKAATGVAKLTLSKALIGVGVLVLAGSAALTIHKMRSGVPSPFETAGDVPPATAPKPAPYPLTTISGWMLDDDTGKPVANMKLLAMIGQDGLIQAAPGEPVLHGFPTTTTDADGRYRISFMLPTTQRQAITIQPDTIEERFTPVAVNVYQGETVNAPVILRTPFAKLHGHVVDADGKPIAGAQVIQTYNTGRATTTDATGAFTDEKGVASGVDWTVAAPGYEVTRFSHEAGAAGDKGAELRVTKKCKAVTGRVVDGEGKPAAKVQICCTRSANTVPYWSTVSDADGRFTMATMPQPGSAVLWPKRDGHDAGLPVDVKPGDTDVTVKLFASGRLEVVVKDAEGKPQAGVTIWGGPKVMQTVDTRVHGTTNEQGIFVSEIVPVGTYGISPSSRNVPGGTLSAAASEFTIEAGKTAKVAFTMRLDPAAAAKKAEGIKASGVLVDADGNPILHAYVHVCLKRAAKAPAQQDELYLGQVLTDVTGHFETVLILHSLDRIMEQHRMFEEKIEAPAKVNQVRFVATLESDINVLHRQSPREFQGGTSRVLDLSASYLVDSTVEWPEKDASCDAGKLASTVPGERVVPLAFADDTPAWRNRKPCVASTCLDESGKAVPCRALPPRSPRDSGFPVAVRSKNAVRVTLVNRFDDSAVAAIPADTGREASVTASFPSARHLEYTIVDEKDNPVSGMQLFAYGDPDPFHNTSSDYTLVSGPDGKITIDLSARAAGKFNLLCFEKLNFQPFHGVLIAGTTPLTQTIRLKNSDAEISGRVLDAQGHPVTAANVSFHASLGLENVSTLRELPLDENGSFRFAVPAGLDIQLKASSGGLSGESEQLKITPGQKLTVDVKIGAPKPPVQRHPQPAKPPAPPPSSSDF